MSGFNFEENKNPDDAQPMLGSDPTRSPIIGTADVADDAVTFAKMQNISTDKILGRATAGTGDPEEIALTAAGRALVAGANVAAQLATLGAEATANKNVTGGYPGFTAVTAFTPGISFGGASVGVAYSAQTGYYIKIANCIIATITIGLTSKGSSTGSLKFTGLPVAPDGKNYAFHPRCSGLGATVTGTPQCIISSTATTITVEQLINGANSDLTDAHVNNTSSFVLTFIYFV